MATNSSDAPWLTGTARDATETARATAIFDAAGLGEKASAQASAAATGHHLTGPEETSIARDATLTDRAAISTARNVSSIDRVVSSTVRGGTSTVRGGTSTAHDETSTAHGGTLIGPGRISIARVATLTDHDEISIARGVSSSGQVTSSSDRAATTGGPTSDRRTIDRADRDPKAGATGSRATTGPVTAELTDAVSAGLRRERGSSVRRRLRPWPRMRS